MRTAFTLLSLLVFGGLAVADPPAPGPVAPPKPVVPVPVAKPAEKPQTPEQAADATLVAVKAKDDAALKALAAKDDPDPWLVADELIRRGEFDAADGFAKAAPRVDVEKLPVYVASRRGKPDDAARRARLAAANAALVAGTPDEALEALGAEVPGPIEDVVGVRLAMARGVSLGSLVQLGPSAAAFLAAAEAAERIGWLARASTALRKAGASAGRGADYPAALSALGSSLRLDDARGDKAGVAATLCNLGLVYVELGEHAKAIATYERALAANEELGQKTDVARTLVNMGVAYGALGDYSKALV